MVYIREAHALDSPWPMGGKGRGPLVEEPLTPAERLALAGTCALELDLSPLTVVIDGLDDATSRAYVSWPDRLYLVDKQGVIAYAGAKGPRGFKPSELEAAIREELGLPEEEQERGGKDN